MKIIELSAYYTIGGGNKFTWTGRRRQHVDHMKQDNLFGKMRPNESIKKRWMQVIELAHVTLY